MSGNIKKKLSPFQIILLGFTAVILIGAFLLMLPVSSQTAEVTPFLDALFTSTSAVCVTGLIVFDTATHWSIFGQAILLILIQIGGMGVVTVAASFAILSGKKIGLFGRDTMKEAISAPTVGGIVRLTGFLLKGIFLIEFLGAVVMMPVFCSDFGPRGIFMAVFHSVSAFCNAGFDLMGSKGAFSSLTGYATQPVIQVTVMLLIIIGGIGFLTWDDIYRNKWHIRRYRTQSKAVLTVTGILLLLPALYFFFFEFADLPLAERIYASFFQSVTTRTAGFNTVNLTSVSEIGLTLMIMLMLIGGSSGSTAGGMKTNTLAVLSAATLSVFQKKDHVQLMKRRIEDETVRLAAAVCIMYVSLFLTSGIIISATEGLPLLTCLYETASAIGTVGLSLGITPSLGILSKLILMTLMFFGRVGGLTLIYAAIGNHPPQIARPPLDKITVG